MRPANMSLLTKYPQFIAKSVIPRSEYFVCFVASFQMFVIHVLRKFLGSTVITLLWYVTQRSHFYREKGSSLFPETFNNTYD
jgi:hypothetical protein